MNLQPFNTITTLGIALSVMIVGVRADQPIEKVVEQIAKPAQHGKSCKHCEKDKGWPQQMEQIQLRFIRLDHGGMGWDDGMNHSGADANFLAHFAKTSGFKAAKKGESHPIANLAKYPADGFPPFVFITANGNMGRVSNADKAILRDYCLKGGMLIADAGSPQFHRSFNHFIRQVFPDKAFIDIPDDDTLYQIPHHFPKGAPPLFAHAGPRPLGIKHEGRWLVFYHPGDMNDAWKSNEYVEIDEERRQASLNLGVNLVFYAFKNWDEAINKAKKADPQPAK